LNKIVKEKKELVQENIQNMCSANFNKSTVLEVILNKKKDLKYTQIKNIQIKPENIKVTDNLEKLQINLNVSKENSKVKENYPKNVSGYIEKSGFNTILDNSLNKSKPVLCKLNNNLNMNSATNNNINKGNNYKKADKNKKKITQQIAVMPVDSQRRLLKEDRLDVKKYKYFYSKYLRRRHAAKHSNSGETRFKFFLKEIRK